MGLITHPHTLHNQSNWGITEIVGSLRLFWFLKEVEVKKC